MKILYFVSFCYFKVPFFQNFRLPHPISEKNQTLVILPIEVAAPYYMYYNH